MDESTADELWAEIERNQDELLERLEELNERIEVALEQLEVSPDSVDRKAA